MITTLTFYITGSFCQMNMKKRFLGGNDSLSKADVKTVPVVDGGKVVGTISRSAITHYLARHYLEHMEKSVTV